jgi:hypothetical protein
MFRTTHNTCRTRTIPPAATVQLISEDSVLLQFDRNAFFAFLKTDTASRNEAIQLEELFTADQSNIDSICEHTANRDLFFDCRDFITEQLNGGRVKITDLHTGKSIKRYKCKTCYVNPGLFRKGDLFWMSYYVPRKKIEIYFRRYRTIHF